MKTDIDKLIDNSTWSIKMYIGMLLFFLGNGKPELTYGKEYKVIRWFEKHEDGRQFIGIKNDSDERNEYLITRFVTRTTWRNMQIKLILSQ
jgi:hypothetical protein